LAQKEATQKHTIEQHLATLKRGNFIPLSEDSARGERVCLECGYVSPEKIEDKAPQMNTDENNKIFAGGDNKFGKTSFIDNSNKDAFGNRISTSVSQTMYRLKRWDNRIPVGKNEAAIKKAYSKIYAWKTKANFTEAVFEDSLDLYTVLYNNKVRTGQSAELLVLACVYHTCKLHDAKTNITALAKVANVRSKLLFGAYRSVLEAIENLNLSSPQDKRPNENILPPKSFLPAIASKVNAPLAVERRALEILLVLEGLKDFTDGKDRNALVGSALYIAAVEKGHVLTQDELAEASGTTAVTLRKRYHQIQQLPGIQK